MTSLPVCENSVLVCTQCVCAYDLEDLDVRWRAATFVCRCGPAVCALIQGGSNPQLHRGRED